MTLASPIGTKMRKVIDFLVGASTLALAAVLTRFLTPDGYAIAIGPLAVAGIAGAASVLGGVLGGKGQASAVAKQLEQQRRAARQLSFQKIAKSQRQFFNLFREQIAAGLGPQFQQQLAAQIGRIPGLADSGLGVQLGIAGAGFPAIAALQGSLEAAFRQRGGRAAALAPGAAMPAVNPAFAGLQAGITGAANTLAMLQRQPTSTPNLLPNPQQGTGIPDPSMIRFPTNP